MGPLELELIVDAARPAKGVQRQGTHQVSTTVVQIEGDPAQMQCAHRRARSLLSFVPKDALAAIADHRCDVPEVHPEHQALWQSELEDPWTYGARS